MNHLQSDSSSLPAVKVINKSALANSSINPATITTAKKMVIKSEPPHLTNFTTTTPTATNVNKSNISVHLSTKSEPSEKKMVQIPMPDYLEMVKQLRELKERVVRLEEHCEKTSGFIIP